MSFKSLGLSILSLVLTIGFLFGAWFLFALHWIIGVVGIVLLIAVPLGIRSKAINMAKGLLDLVFAKYIIPIVAAICGAVAVMMIIGWIPFPFQ